MTDVPDEGEATGESIDTVAASLDAAVETSVEVVGTGPKDKKSPTGFSTTGDKVAVTLGLGAASFCETDVDWEGTVKVSIDEPPETLDCEAPNSLDLNAYRTAATPTPAPKSTVRICS